jgi:hypothetical protein
MVRGAVGPERVRIERARNTGRVLHVLSQAYETGGHTRLARRWIERDRRQSDVVLTMHGSVVPDHLRTAVAGAGGRLYDLRAAFSTFTGRVAALRRLMDRVDVVVLHVHPGDAIALAAACLPGTRPPVILQNHADHTYWLGVGAADLVVNLRSAADRICVEQRGIRSERLARLPLPIDAAPAASTRKTVRKELGLGPSQVAAVTVAAAYKMTPIWGEGFDTVLGRALTECPELVTVLVGVTADGPWRALQSAFPGRVLPLGVRPDVASLYPGMDIYLDSFPIPSGTSILEAGAAGLPVLGLRSHERYGDVFGFDAPGSEGAGHAAADIDGYLASLRGLVEDPVMRRERGETTRREIIAAHAGEAWSEALERVYARAHQAEPADLDAHPQPSTDLDYAAALRPLTQQEDVTPDPLALSEPLGTSLDPRTRFDISLATHPGRSKSLSVRIAHGWQENPAWTMRLTAMAKQHPVLSASLPFVPGDDPRGTRSIAALAPVLAANGDSLEDCGDLSLDLRTPRTSGPAVTGELPLEPEALDFLELVLSSPYWDDVSPRDDGS